MARARRRSRLGLGEPVGGLEETGEVVKPNGDGGMVGPAVGLVDGEGAAHEWLGLGEPVGGLEELGEVVKPNGDGGMVGTVAGLVDGESAAHERLGLGKAGSTEQVDPDPVQEVGGFLQRDLGGLGVSGGAQRVRHEGIARRPGRRVGCFVRERLIDKRDSGFCPGGSFRSCLGSGHRLHQSMDREDIAVNLDERVASERRDGRVERERGRRRRRQVAQAAPPPDRGTTHAECLPAQDTRTAAAGPVHQARR